MEQYSKNCNILNVYVLPEECIAAIVGLTTPRDACCLEAVSPLFRSAAESDSVWEKFLPPDYSLIAARSDDDTANLLLRYPSKKKIYLHLADRPLLIDGATKSFWLDKPTGKKCCMISARTLSIVWSDTPRYWKWISIPESRFSDVAELIMVCWLEIKAKIKTSLLSPRTRYGAYLVFKMTEEAHGFDWHAETSVGVPGGKTETRAAFFEQEDQRRRRQMMPRRIRLLNRVRIPVFELQQEEEIRPPMINRVGAGPDTSATGGRATDDSSRYPKQRGDGWMEMWIGSFFNDGGADQHEVELSVTEVKHGNWKSGLIVEGIEIRSEEA